MRRLCGSVGGQVSCDLLGTCGGVVSVDGTVEDCQSSDRLVVWDFMARLVHSCEGEVSVLAGLAVLDAVDHHADVACLRKFGGVGVVHSQGDGLAAEPVTVEVISSRSRQGVDEESASRDGQWVVNLPDVIGISIDE